MPAHSAPAPSFQALSPAQLQATAAPRTTWLWDGYLAAGNVTLLTSPWKAGKTTLTAALLARMHAGGTLAGRAVQPGRAVVVSEESAVQWAERCGKFGIGDHVCFLCRPFCGQPRLEDWQALLDHLLALHRAAPLGLIAIDPLAAFLPGRGANDPAVMLAALLPLQPLTSAGVAVLLLHHPRKQASAAGQWARGSGALSGFADVLLEMHYYSTAEAADRRRKLFAFSRHDATPRQLVIELDAAGTDWLSRGDVDEEAFTQSWAVLHTVLAEAPDKRTRQQLLDDWPKEAAAPSPATLHRWLERAVADGTVQRDGTGRSHDPFRYWLKGQEEKWKAADPFWEQRQQDEEILRKLHQGDWEAPRPRRKHR